MADETMRPTPAELSILQALWRRGTATVRDVHEELVDRGTGYTTVLKLMQIMTEKGLVRRLDSGRAHVYEAAITRDQTQRQTVRELVDRVFEGSANQLVQHALTERPASREEIAEIRRLLDSLEAQK